MLIYFFFSVWFWAVVVSWPVGTLHLTSLKRKIQISAQSSCHRTEMPHWLAYSYDWLINLVSFHANFPISLLILRCHRYVVHFNFCAKPNESKVWKELSSRMWERDDATAKETYNKWNNNNNNKSKSKWRQFWAQVVELLNHCRIWRRHVGKPQLKCNAQNDDEEAQITFGNRKYLTELEHTIELISPVSNYDFECIFWEIKIASTTFIRNHGWFWRKKTHVRYDTMLAGFNCAALKETNSLDSLTFSNNIKVCTS